MNEQQSQNLLLKVDPLSSIRNNKLNTQGEKLETAKLRVFLSNISPSVKAAICERTQHTGYSFCFVVHVSGLHVFKENLKVYINKEPSKNLLFSYYKLGCRSFELNIFLHCFNLKDLNLNKHIERFKKDLLFALQLTDMIKCPKCMLFTLRDQII